MTHLPYKPLLHRIALLTTIATFPLIFMGGLVTSHGAGLSVPDWPNSYGYNMFTFPPSKWIGGIFYEHTHRLMGTIVGLTSTLFLMIAWGWGTKERVRRKLLMCGVAALLFAIIAGVIPAIRPYHLMELAAVAAFVLLGSTLCRNPEPRRWVRWLGVAVFVGVVVQGALGGLRVELVRLGLAIVHACFAQAFLCVAAFAAIVTSRWWLTAPDLSETSVRPRGQALIGFTVAAVLVIFAQLIAGATMRHYDAGLAIPDLPLAYGQVLPPTTADELANVNSHRAWDLHLKHVTLEQIWWHFAHRVGAILVTILIGVVATLAFRDHRRHRELTRPVIALLVLLVAQLTLGVFTVLLRKPADIASLHVAVGALVLVTTFVLAIRAMRFYARVFRAPAGELAHRDEGESAPEVEFARPPASAAHFG